MTRDAQDFWRAFGSGVVSTRFNDVGRSRTGIEPQSPEREVSTLSLRHRGGHINRDL